MFCWFSASGTFCNTYGTFCNSITWHLTREWDVLQHIWDILLQFTWHLTRAWAFLQHIWDVLQHIWDVLQHIWDILQHIWNLLQRSSDRGAFATIGDLFATLVFMLQLCENMRREGSYAKTCGFNRNMRFHAEKVKICDLMRKIQKYAVSHVPHLNRVPVTPSHHTANSVKQTKKPKKMVQPPLRP